MAIYPVKGKRILEIGCGIGLAGMVTQQRDADITFTDYHPMVEEFLIRNFAINDLTLLKYQRGSWFDSGFDLGLFDLIIASDVLYSPERQLILPHFIERHLAPGGEVMIVDPGRHQDRAFNRAMITLGHTVDERKVIFEDEFNVKTHCRIYNYHRTLV